MNFYMEDLERKGFIMKDGKLVRAKPEDKPRFKTDELERKLQTRVEKWLKGKDFYFFHIRKAQGNPKGIPDIVLCYYGRFVGIELKTQTKQTMEQLIAEKKIQATGGFYLLASSLKQVQDGLKRISETGVYGSP